MFVFQEQKTARTEELAFTKYADLSFDLVDMLNWFCIMCNGLPAQMDTGFDAEI